MNDNINKLKSKEAEILADIELLGLKLQIIRDERRNIQNETHKTQKGASI